MKTLKIMEYARAFLVVSFVMFLMVFGAVAFDHNAANETYSTLQYYDRPLEKGSVLNDDEGIYCYFKGGKLTMIFYTEIDDTLTSQTFECCNKRRSLYLLKKVDKSYSFKLVTNSGTREISRDELTHLIQDYNFSSWSIL